ncbi:toprim domain-containing protein [Flexithrix dorotheae]|uniref:toprim domain-containing protein n=1 Tax=Flexithrix dorotheae TaxID=70993 RepID=UPI00035C7456|nr:toprim domain-containing protein [Flexithrix dorotheae]
MTYQEANEIQLTDLLSRMGYEPDRIRGKNYWYKSPFRQERTASFKLDIHTNMWYDFGEGAGGGTIDFAKYYLRTEDFKTALEWLGGNTLSPVAPKRANLKKVKIHKEIYFKLIEVSTLRKPTLFKYLRTRGITRELGKSYLKQVSFGNAEKAFSGLGFENDEGGIEVRNSFYKGCFGKKSITTICGKLAKKNRVLVFEGFMDFLSYQTMKKSYHEGDEYIVMNSLSSQQQLLEKIEKVPYQQVHLFLDNDAAGKKATASIKAILEEEKKDKLVIKTWNHLYEQSKDLNDFLVRKLENEKANMITNSSQNKLKP